MKNRRVVSSLQLEGRVLHAQKVNRLLLFENRSGRLDDSIEENRHAIGNSTLNAAAVIGAGFHALHIPIERVVSLRAAQIRQREAAAELDTLDRRNGEDRVREHSLQRIEPRFTNACRHSCHRGFQNPADAVAIRGRFEDLAADQRACLRVQYRKLRVREIGEFLRVVLESAILHARRAQNMRTDKDAAILQGARQNRARCHQRRGHASRKMAAAAIVLIAFIFAEARIIRVGRARRPVLAPVPVIRAVRLFVADQKAQRCPCRTALKDTADKFHAVFLLARRRDHALRAPLSQFIADITFIDHQSRRQPVQYRADCRAVTLAE